LPLPVEKIEEKGIAQQAKLVVNAACNEMDDRVAVWKNIIQPSARLRCE
jgi:hypothetical protein